MKEILVFRHAAGEGPGYFARYLDRRAVPFRLIKVDQNETIPESIDHVAGLVFMGGPMSVNDALPWIPKTLELIRRAVAADLPVLGQMAGHPSFNHIGSVSLGDADKPAGCQRSGRAITASLLSLGN